MAHVLMYEDDSPACMICGASWIDDASYEADEWDCSGNTSQCHHYAGECASGLPDDECTLMDCGCNLCG